jgi:glucose/arabinose dehydrogenase
VKTRRLRAAGIGLVVLAFAGCGSDSPTPSPAASPTPPSGTCSGGEPVAGTPRLTTRVVASGLASPVDVQAAPGDRSRLFVVEQGGRIRIVRNGQVLGASFLDVSGRIASGGERGLLGLAFHPRYADNGRFFVNYTDPNGDTHISEFRVSSNPDAVDAASERILLTVDQPFANHNGGGLAFGNDGMLYAGLGDGGSGGDPFGNGQNLSTRLGKMLRVDVDRSGLVPPDNPFVGRPGAAPEIWAYGLRNPWRFSFDRGTGDLYIGDVGQDSYEEIDVERAPRHGGQDYGWNIMEGTHCYNAASCGTAGLTLPVLDYGHGAGCSVTGGVVYRGCRLPGYAGTYFYGDYCSAFVRSFRYQNGAVTDPRDWTNSLSQGLSSISSFGVDAEGEIYIVDLEGGTVREVVPGE